MMDSFERAYAAARSRSDPVLAAAAAMSLVGYHKQFFGNMAAARGWLARAARIVETEAPQLRGELLGATSFVTDDPVECERLAREAWDDRTGRRQRRPGVAGDDRGRRRAGAAGPHRRGHGAAGRGDGRGGRRRVRRSADRRARRAA